VLGDGGCVIPVEPQYLQCSVPSPDIYRCQKQNSPTICTPNFTAYGGYGQYLFYNFIVFLSHLSLFMNMLCVCVCACVCVCVRVCVCVHVHNGARFPFLRNRNL
jgi:hypothetical protein